jgi:EAL domain-containing protein (putative c-di-GMP-specific phosphodiesterase class I)
MPTDPLERLALPTRLRNALAAGEFVLHWQPIMELEGGEIVSLEALLRWEDQERGLIPAAEFIPIAEEMGLIEQIDAWVVDAIARQARAWGDDGLAPRLSFNVSAHDLRRPGTLAAMAARLAGSDLDASLFTVEVDESGALDSRGQLAPALRDLHAAGIGIAIDRFGSGLSALARLREMPLSALKIDGAFVARAPEDEATASLVDGILGFAGALGVSAIAEHVETEEQRRFLIDHGCRSGQGYHLAKPAGTAETTALLYRDRESE